MASSAPLTIVVAKGAWGSVEFVVRRSGACPGKEFFQNDCEDVREGAKDEVDATARARFAVLFRQMANYGDVTPKRFAKEMGRLYAFKHEVANVQIRFPCFQDGKRWLLTHGFKKPGAKKKRGAWPQSEIDRANEIMQEYFDRKSDKN